MKKKKTWVLVILTTLSVALFASVSFYILKGITGSTKGYTVNEELVGEELTRAEELQKYLKKNPPGRPNEVGKVRPRLDTGLVFDDREKLNARNLSRAMHLMTHQKISAEAKDGAIPMTHENIRELREYLELARKKNKMDLNDYLKLGNIIERWENADFSEIDKEQDYLLDEMDAKIGYSNGLATPEEEELFILNNFGEDYVYTINLEPMEKTEE